MDATLIVMLALAALVLGGLIGWLVGSRAAAASREVIESLRLQLDGVVGERDTHRAEADRLRGAHAEASSELAAFKAGQEERERSFASRMADLKISEEETKTRLTTQFSEIGGKLLGEAQKQFLERADQRFNEAGKESEAKLKLLLQPVETTLKRYEEGLKEVEKDRVGSYRELREAVEQVRVGQTEVKNEAAKLVNALRAAPKTRGRWGEQQFKNLIEIAGLTNFVDFSEEVSVHTDDGLLRPDFIIRLPGDQQLVVDVKCSLDAYLKSGESGEGVDRKQFLDDHARALRTHADALAKKSYWDQFEKAPDFVIMYVPGDNFVSAALEADLDLWERAAKKRVIICGPSTFLPMARTVAGIWRQEKLASEAKKIGALGKLIYDRLAVAAGHLKTVGGGLTTAVNNYNKFVNSFETRVLVTGREFRDLNIETGGKEIEQLPPVEALARYGDDKVLPPPSANEDDAA